MVFTRRQSYLNLQHRIRYMPREVRITIFKYLDVDVDVLFKIPVFLFKEWFDENKNTGRVGKKLWLRLHIQFVLEEVPNTLLFLTPLEKRRVMKNVTFLSKRHVDRKLKTLRLVDECYKHFYDVLNYERVLIKNFWSWRVWLEKDIFNSIGRFFVYNGYEIILVDDFTVFESCYKKNVEDVFDICKKVKFVKQ